MYISRTHNSARYKRLNLYRTWKRIRRQREGKKNKKKKNVPFKLVSQLYACTYVGTLRMYNTQWSRLAHRESTGSFLANCSDPWIIANYKRADPFYRALPKFIVDDKGIWPRSCRCKGGLTSTTTLSNTRANKLRAWIPLLRRITFFAPFFRDAHIPILNRPVTTPQCVCIPCTYVCACVCVCVASGGLL